MTERETAETPPAGGCCGPTSTKDRTPTDAAKCGVPRAVDRRTFQAALESLRKREKMHTRQGDAIAAARRRLPMVEVDAELQLLGPHGPTTLLDVFEGRRQLVAYYFMWYPGRPASEQCEGCTFFAGQVAELTHLHSRDITFAVLCQGRNVSTGPSDARQSYRAMLRYREFMGWQMPWYSAQPSLDRLLVGREIGLFHLVCYLRDGDRVLETYWTTRRGVEAMDNSYALMDLTAYGRQEWWEDSPPGWPQERGNMRTAAGAPDWPAVAHWPNGRPIAQWARLAGGRSDDIAATPTPPPSRSHRHA